MTLTATYESTLSRVRLDATGMGTAIDAVFERSLDGVTWTTVRCGTDSPVTSGSATIYDYEFTSGVENTYRVTSAATITFVGVGTAAHANNGGSVAPALPVGTAAGDLLLVVDAIRNLAATPNTPSGYAIQGNFNNLRLHGKPHSGSELAPTVSFTGGAAGDDTTGQMAAFRGVSPTPVDVASTLATPTTQNIPYPALTVTVRRALKLWIGWKQDDWTSVATIAGANELGEPDTTTGNDQGVVWDYRIETGDEPVDITSGSFTVTGGTTATASGAVLTFAPTETVQTTTITPVITDLWIKSVGKPFLNRTVHCVAEIADIERTERHGLFEIIGRNYPVAITDKHQSRQGAIRVVTQTTTEREELDLIIAAGEPMFFHTPLHYPLPTMHVVFQRTVERRPLRNAQCNDLDWRTFTIAWREVAAPGSDVCGSTVTWQSVLNSYATWQDVLNGETSWFDLLTNIGSPSDVIVP